MPRSGPPRGHLLRSPCGQPVERDQAGHAPGALTRRLLAPGAVTLATDTSNTLRIGGVHFADQLAFSVREFRLWAR